MSRAEPTDSEEDVMASDSEADHTSGVMRCEYEVVGGHVHCRVFGPYSGKAGDLVFRVEEWDHVRRIHPGWQFKERVRG